MVEYLQQLEHEENQRKARQVRFREVSPAAGRLDKDETDRDRSPHGKAADKIDDLKEKLKQAVVDADEKRLRSSRRSLPTMAWRRQSGRMGSIHFRAPGVLEYVPHLQWSRQGVADAATHDPSSWPFDLLMGPAATSASSDNEARNDFRLFSPAD